MEVMMDVAKLMDAGKMLKGLREISGELSEYDLLFVRALSVQINLDISEAVFQKLIEVHANYFKEGA
jgi:hypothetical protein